ncbi:MAG: tRNA lysidine(34) synthetase TilS [Planctomycetaceae bacterium]|nr:tRNA lysidine(34) synthetase TilS [Planctomycetaceae bacterium]MBP60051.1 tRNA lysidine(34) synthetase TilS [Planctomycetaceae bacterium]
MANWHPFESRLSHSWPREDWQDISVVIAVSGGADSVALLRGLVALKQDGTGTLHVVHINHQLRGTAADADQKFVEQLSDSINLPVHTLRADVRTMAQERGDGIEEAARQARYDLLQATAEKLGARFVVTAHTADDQVETILYRIFRGTGISGLRGIPRVRRLGPAVSLLRPLLDVRRSEVETYLESLEQPYCHDSSNDEVHYQRNKIRHHLLPELAGQYNSQVSQALLRLGQLSGETWSVIEDTVTRLFEQCQVEAGKNSCQINVSPLKIAHPLLVRELFHYLWREQSWPLQSMGFEQWHQLAALVTVEAGPPTQITLPGPVIARRDGDWIRLSRTQPDD